MSAASFIVARLEHTAQLPRRLRQDAIGRLGRLHRQRNVGCRLLRLCTAVFYRASLKLGLRLTVSGREHLPTAGPFVIVSNHASHLDAPCLLAALPMRRAVLASPAAASDYFFATLPGAAAAALLVNALPFDRGPGRCGRCLNACHGLLSGGRDGQSDSRSGRVLIVFPEGTRSADGSVGAFKRGIGELVAGTTVPVIPCHIDGAFEVWPRHRWLPRFRKVRVTIGRPRSYAHFPHGKASAIAIANDLRDAVLALAPEPKRPSDTSVLPLPNASASLEVEPSQFVHRTHGRDARVTGVLHESR